MMFVIEGLDGANTASLRAQHLGAHVGHLRSLGDRFVIGGPFLDQNGVSIGSLVVIEAETQAAAEAFAASDPFVLNKVFATVTVRRWEFGHLRASGRN